MRFFVTLRTQNASFRRMRFSSPGQTWRHLTERRTLGPSPHGKTHSGPAASRKSAVCGRHPHGKPQSGRLGYRGVRFSVTSRRLGGVGQPPRQAAGRVARGFANLGLEFGLTEKCTLKPTDWAECTFPSRRPPRVRVFVTLRMQSALFREGVGTECAFP